jgi:hypothetical protein
MPETQRLDIATNGYAGATLIAAHSAMFCGNKKLIASGSNFRHRITTKRQSKKKASFPKGL